MNFWEQMCCALSEEMSIEFFLPYVPMLPKMKKIHKNKKCKNFEKQNKTKKKHSGDMAER